MADSHYPPLPDSILPFMPAEDAVGQNPNPAAGNSFFSANNILRPFLETLSLGEVESTYGLWSPVAPTAAEDHSQLWSLLKRNDNVINKGQCNILCLDGNVLQQIPPPPPPQAGLFLGFEGGSFPLPSVNYQFAAGICSSSNNNNGYGLDTFQRAIGRYPPPSVTRNVQESQGIRSPENMAGDFVPSGPRMNRICRRHAKTCRDGREVDERLEREEREAFESIKKKIEAGNMAHIPRIITATSDVLHKMMAHKHGNGVVQSLFRFCHKLYFDELLLSVIGKEELFISLCMHNIGNRCVVGMLESLQTPEHREMVASVISRHVIILTTHSNGHNVLKQCFLSLDQIHNKAILLKMGESSVEIAQQKAGCCILQYSISHAQGEVLERLVAPLIASAELLSRHQYGNYVVQFIVELGWPEMTRRVIMELTDNYIQLSMDKFGSNVVEKCLLFGEPACVASIVFEIVRSQDFCRFLNDEFGNFVAQKAIEQARGAAYDFLMKSIRRNQFFIQDNPFGRRVAAAVRRAERQCTSDFCGNI